MTYKVLHHQLLANILCSLPIPLLLAHPVQGCTCLLLVPTSCQAQSGLRLCTFYSFFLKWSLHGVVCSSLSYLIQILIQMFAERLPLTIPSKIVSRLLLLFFLWNFPPSDVILFTYLFTGLFSTSSTRT